MEAYDENEDKNGLSRILSNDIIPQYDVTMVIESLSIEQMINLNHKIITDSLGRIQEKEFDFIDNENNEIISNNNSKIVERAILDFDNEDLLAEFGE